MINLLPPELRSSLDYARRNTKLRKWLVISSTILILMVVTILGGLVYLKQTSKSLARQIDNSKAQLQVQNQDKVAKSVEDLTGTLKLVVQVLSREVLFSKLLKQIGSVMPSGSILTSLSINQLSGGLDLQAKASDYQTATQVQLNLQDPKSVLFEKVDIVNIQCQTAVTADPVAAKYPCTIQMRALFNKTNPFLFIGNAGSSK